MSLYGNYPKQPWAEMGKRIVDMAPHVSVQAEQAQIQKNAHAADSKNVFPLITPPQSSRCDFMKRTAFMDLGFWRGKAFF